MEKIEHFSIYLYQISRMLIRKYWFVIGYVSIRHVIYLY